MDISRLFSHNSRICLQEKDDILEIYPTACMLENSMYNNKCKSYIEMEFEFLNLDNYVKLNSNQTIKINNIHFKKPISFLGNVFEKAKVVFNNCEFYSSIVLEKQYPKNIVFEKCYFKDKKIFEKFKNNYILYNVKFSDCYIGFEKEETIIYNGNFKKLVIEKSLYENNLSIQKCEIVALYINRQNFYNLEIKKTNINRQNFYNLEIKETNFKKLKADIVNFQNLFLEDIECGQIEFKNCNFIEKSSFNRLKLQGDISFYCDKSEKNIIKQIPEFASIDSFEKQNIEIIFNGYKFDCSVCLSDFNDALINNKNKQNIIIFKFIDCEFLRGLDYSDEVLNSFNFANCKFLENINIDDLKFKEDISFVDCEFIEKFIINDCEFDKNINFKGAIFEKDFIFKKSKVLKNADFSKINFNKDAFFDNSIFNGYSDFHTSEFNNVAGFYGVQFSDIMNFSSVIFKDFNKINFINLDTENIKFETMQKRNSDFCDEHSLNNIEIINSFRDSFRIIKHSLASVNNLLESSKFHKLELYAKEIELYYKNQKYYDSLYKNDNKKIEKINNNKPIKPTNSNINWKNFMIIGLILFICIALYFLKDYKITDKIVLKDIYFMFKNTIFYLFLCMIGLFCAYIIIKILIKLLTLSFCVIRFAINIFMHYFLYPKDIYDFKSRARYSFYKYKRFIKLKTGKLLNLTKYIDYSLLVLYRHTSEHHTNFTRILNFTIVMIAAFGIVCYCLDFMLDFKIFNFLSFIPVAVFFIFFSRDDFLSPLFAIFVLITMLVYFLLPKNMVLFFILLYITIVVLGLFLFTKKDNLTIVLVRSTAYIIVFSMLVLNSALIVPFLNFNKNSENKYLIEYINDSNNTLETKREILSNVDVIKISADKLELKDAIEKDKIRSKSFKSINFIYSIILGLCLYSLQKTARRNSIVSK